MRLNANQATVVFPGEHGDGLHALGPVSFEVESGTFVGLLGPSGCGKSTLIRLFAGLQPPSSGSVTVGGVPVREPLPQVSIMFQAANLMPWRSVIENIALPLEIAGVDAKTRRKAAHDLLSGLGLTGFENAYPGELSGGMAQRVALGRVFIQQPAVLLLDEPFGALDALTREQISLELLEMWRRQQQTLLMVTHDIQEAVLLSDRVMVLSRRPGRLVDDIPVTLPRPRHLEMVYSEAFLSIARRVRQAIDRA